MKAKMLFTMNASPNGIAIVLYKKGEVYDLTERLFNLFIKNKWAEKVIESFEEQKLDSDLEEQAFTSVPKKKKKESEVNDD